MPDVKDEIGKLRAQLLDMGKSNNLVNYQSRDDRSIRIVDIKPDAIFDRLVMSGEGLRIMSKKSINVSVEDIRSNSSQLDIDRKLNRLMRIHLEDFEDLGYTTIYMALGFMNWRIKTSINKAPIVLVPLEPKRDQSGNVRLYWNGDDVKVSPTFIEKLRELKITAPLPDTIENVPHLNEVLDLLKETTDERTGFKINSSIIVDTFDFSKSVMYNDIDPSTWSEIPSLVDMILNPSSSAREANEERYIPSCTYSILDGDSSQMNVVMDVLEGKSVVVEGPPGTGKSQTIANIISECLGNGKTVLFVSEKMAALNVVRRRLDNAGISSYIMELHSDNMNRKNFLKEMERSIDREEPFEALSEQDCYRLERIRRDLDEYNKAVSEPIGARELTPYQLIGMRDIAQGNIRRRRRTPSRVEIKNPHAIDNEDWDYYMGILRTAAEVIPQVMPIKKNFWKDSDMSSFTPDTEHSMRAHMLNVSRRLDDVQVSVKDLCRTLGIVPPQTIGDIMAVDEISRNILRHGSISLKDALEGDPDDYMRSADEVINSLNEINSLRSKLLERYNKGILKLNADELYEEYRKASKKVFHSKTYRDILEKVESFALSPPVNENEAEDDLRILRDYQSRLETFSSVNRKNLFGEKWLGKDSDLEELRSFRDWMITVKRSVGSGRFSDATMLIISRGGVGTPLEEKYRDIENYISDLMKSLNTIFGILGMKPEDKFSKGFTDMRPAALKKWLKEINTNMDTLRPWGNYCDLMDKFKNSSINDIAVKVARGDIHPMDIMDNFVQAYASVLLADAVNSRPKLNDFSYEIQEMLVKDFDDIDREVLEQNGQKLRKRLYQISQERMAEEDEGIRILKGEFNRGSGQMSVRKIMELAGASVQAVKPCFMMSPMSVAQYLSNKDMRFDVVIFDEASQILPADSLGSLMRASQAVIMGDSKQLPPTVFFERREEGTAEIATAKDMESLLNLCRASLPVRVLSWHYRSRHDSLMALSNRLFYDDKLMVCPSPSPAMDDKGLKLRYVRTAVYDRGATGTNQKEAKMIAREVWHHYIETPYKSLGVACFNINQQKAITEEVEKMFKRHPDARTSMMKHVAEPFIIRNLENIQGDERDVMFISIGYGYDSDGKLSKSFGSLNRAGGERRLNVLMTRAREKCVIFSNFRSMDMGMRDNVPEGVSSLQAYLEYAEHGQTSKLTSTPIRDELVDSVAGFLASKGVRTAINVGTSGLRIDVAVCSPKDPSIYILGICLDGRTYQNMTYTRDRDRTFMSLLRQMGWSTYRLWSMDWYSNPDSAKKRLWNKVSGALAKAGKKETVDPKLFELVSEIVEIESPIKRDAVMMKVRSARNIDTIPVKMVRDIDECLYIGMSLDRFREEDGFMIVPDRPIVPRERSSKEKWKPEWIHPQEYVKALKESISIELSEDEILANALYLLGLPNHKPFREEASKYIGMD